MTDKKKEEGFEHDQEQIENLIKPSPKKKPPRTDRQNRKIDIVDKDLSKSDTDLSMNYKDIGGSCRRVLMRTLKASAPYDSDEDESQALRLYSFPEEELLQCLDDPSLRPHAECALKMKMRPLPPGWDANDSFEYAQLKLNHRRRFRRHMAEWDGTSFPLNLHYFQEKLLNESLTSGREEREDYYKALIVMVEESFKAFKAQTQTPLNSIYEALHGLKGPDQDYISNKEFDERISQWKLRLKRTCPSHLDTVYKELSNVDFDQISPTSNLYQWLQILQALVRGSRIQQPNSKSASLFFL